MDFEQAVTRRRMVRRFDPSRPPSRATIDRLLDLARRGPSAGHTQGWHFLVLDDAAGRDAFWAATTDPGAPADVWLTGLRTAPVLVIVLTSRAAYVRRYEESDKQRPDGQKSDRQGSDGSGSDTTFAAPWWWVDAGMAAHTLLLGAVDRGLGACLFGVPPTRVDAVRAAFGVPAQWSALGVVAIGAPATEQRRSPSLRRGRRPWTEVVSFGRYGTGRGGGS